MLVHYLKNLKSLFTTNYLFIFGTLVLVLVFYTTLVNAWIGDDAQITFRQVWNFISGDGITFNISERVQAFTHPLWFLVLSLFGFFTQELFLTTIIISIIFSVASAILLMKIEFDQNQGNQTILSPVIFLIFCWSFSDYTTSGLENPLTFFLTGILIYYLSLENWNQKIQEMFLVLSLLVLNRLDYLVLFFPLAIFLIWNCGNIRKLARAIWPGSLLMLGWFVFSTFYFGSPFPNTFYAKLNAGYPIDEVLMRGWTYILSMSDDLSSIFVIVSALILTVFTRNLRLICLSLGQLCYCLYIIRAGGDFMLGRYFAILVFISVAQIIVSLKLIKNLKIVSKNTLVLGMFTILLFIGDGDRYPFRSSIETESRRPLEGTQKLDSHIIDERNHYRWIFGLYSKKRDGWPIIYNQGDRLPTDYRTTCGILGGSALIEPNINLIDVCGLADPFMSRLPAIQVKSWRIGHHIRKMPMNYGEFKLRQVDVLDDSRLTELAIDIRTISSGPLFGIERLKAIWRINSGFHSGIEFEKYTNPNIFVPFSSFTEIVQLDSWDSGFEHEKLAPIYGTFSYKYFGSNIKFQSIEPKISKEIEIQTNSEFTYQVYINEKFYTTIEKIELDRVVGGEYNLTLIPLFEETKVYSIELRAVDAYYIGDTSINAISSIKFKDIRNVNNWEMANGNFENHRYSWLEQINKNNADQLQVAWTFSTGSLFGHQGAPLVVGSIMYIHTPFPNTVYALDLNNKGKILWKYFPVQNSDVLSVLCCGKSNRGLFYVDGKILLHQTDLTLIALDAYNGSLIWRTVTGSTEGGSNTASILVAKDKVIVGIGGGESAIRGYISAYDLQTGGLVWRGFSTGTDKDMLIEPEKTTELGKPVGRNTSLKSWRGDQWRIGGGATWGWFSYDMESNLLFYGTGNPAPWNPVQRPGDNKWTNAIFARNLDTGVVKWVYQFTPNDQWDFDGVNEMVLVNDSYNGIVRKLLVHFDRNGFVYTFDRISGELLEAKKFELSTNWATKIELDENSENYGRPLLNMEISPKHQGENIWIENICPAQLGAKNQQPVSYSPELKLFFVPTIHLCMDYEIYKVKYVAGSPALGASFELYPVKGSHGGAGNLLAWDNKKEEIVWSIPETFPVWSGPLSTAGGIVIYGTFEGYLKVVDATTGENLYQFKTPTGIIGNVMSYMHNGRQFIAVFSGIGGTSNIGLAAGLTRSTENVNSETAYTSLSQFTSGGQLTVFSLPN